MKNFVILILGIIVGALAFWIVQTTQNRAKDAQRSATVHNESPSAANATAPAPTGKKVVIGFSVPGTDHGWLGAVKRNAEEAAKNFNDAELILTDAQNSSEKQAADIDSLIQRKVDVIVMLPNSGKALTPAAKKIREAGIPLINLDRRIESNDYVTYIGGDNYGIGATAARFFGRELKGKGSVAEVMGLAGLSVTSDRHNGFINTLKEEFPGIQVVISLVADFSADKALGVTENILQSHPSIDAIYSHDDDMNVGVLQAVTHSGKADKIFITGVGGSRLMMENIQKGGTPVRASFLYNPSMAGSAYNLARLIAKGEGMKDLWEPEVPREVVIRASEISQGTVGKFLKLGY